MTKFNAQYLGQLRTSTTHLQSGNNLLTDAPKDNHGKGETFSPTDLVATALGACMASIMGIVANKNQWNISTSMNRSINLFARDYSQTINCNYLISSMNQFTTW